MTDLIKFESIVKSEGFAEKITFASNEIESWEMEWPVEDDPYHPDAQFYVCTRRSTTTQYLTVKLKDGSHFRFQKDLKTGEVFVIEVAISGKRF